MEDVQRGKQALLIYSGPFSHSFLTKTLIFIISIYLCFSLYPSICHLTVYLSIYHLLIILALCSSQKFTLFLCKDCSLTLHLILHIFSLYTQSTNVLRKKKYTHTHTHTTHRRMLFADVPQFTPLCSCCFFFFEQTVASTTYFFLSKNLFLNSPCLLFNEFSHL